LKLLNKVISEDGNVYPLNYQNCIDIVNIFKERDISLIKLSSLFSFIFPQNAQEHHRSRKGNLDAMNTIVLKLFPIMSLSYNGEIYILDVTKMNIDNNLVLEFLLDILGDPQLTNLENISNNDGKQGEIQII